MSNEDDEILFKFNKKLMSIKSTLMTQVSVILLLVRFPKITKSESNMTQTEAMLHIDVCDFVLKLSSTQQL